MIGQNIEVSKLTEFLKHHVKILNFDIHPEDLENQKVAPINAILDLLGSKNHGVFEILSLSKELLHKSHWAERLGELSNDEENGAVLIERTKSGLKLSTVKNEEENEDDIQDDEEDEEDEEEDEDQDEEEDDDEEENS